MYIIIVIILISLVLYPFTQTTGKQVTTTQTAYIGTIQDLDQCSSLSWWKCITASGCNWNFNACESTSADCSGLNFQECSASLDCRWNLDYDGAPFECECIESDGSPYLGDICYNCIKDPMEEGIDCGGECSDKKTC